MASVAVNLVRSGLRPETVALSVGSAGAASPRSSTRGSWSERACPHRGSWNRSSRSPSCSAPSCRGITVYPLARPSFRRRQPGTPSSSGGSRSGPQAPLRSRFAASSGSTLECLASGVKPRLLGASSPCASLRCVAMVPPDGGCRVDGCARQAPCRPAVCCPGPTCWASRSCRVHGLTSPRPSASAVSRCCGKTRTRPRRRRRVRTRSTCVADSRRSGSPIPVEADRFRSKWINFLPEVDRRFSDP